LFSHRLLQHLEFRTKLCLNSLSAHSGTSPPRHVPISADRWAFWRTARASALLSPSSPPPPLLLLPLLLRSRPAAGGHRPPRGPGPRGRPVPRRAARGARPAQRRGRARPPAGRRDRRGRAAAGAAAGGARRRDERRFSGRAADGARSLRIHRPAADGAQSSSHPPAGRRRRAVAVASAGRAFASAPRCPSAPVLYRRRGRSAPVITGTAAGCVGSGPPPALP
jgi:hypothetical protein